MSDRFYTPQPLAPGEFVLDGPEAHHLATVRRIAVGERVTLFNGDGQEYLAEVLATGKKAVSVMILTVEKRDRETRNPLIIASALPKGDRADFLLEKLTELGVSRFIPLITARSVVLPRGTKMEKFTRQVIEASKQCGRNTLMVIEPPCRWPDFLAATDLPHARFLLHPGVATPAAVPFPPVAGACIAIGPEGGFADEEVAAARGVGWAPLSLGSRILRIETAALAAAALFDYHDFHRA
ncbi:MAG: 16S rRNA (uracil(1498)-N(3))-methyltransferase [Bacteroidales bacterium]|nr:16S rRNA (uracil(1498)-N(3))-methyltransferase [Bacteroidales bacterium]